MQTTHCKECQESFNEVDRYQKTKMCVDCYKNWRKIFDDKTICSKCLLTYDENHRRIKGTRICSACKEEYMKVYRGGINYYEKYHKEYRYDEKNARISVIDRIHVLAFRSFFKVYASDGPPCVETNLYAFDRALEYTSDDRFDETLAKHWINQYG